MNFFLSLFKDIRYAFTGPLHFPRNHVGKEFMMDGENCSHSMAARFMINRSVPGSVSFKVIPNT